MSDTLQLGGNIELTGFSDVDSSSMIVLKKIIGNYARRFSDKASFEKLSIAMKNGSNVFELSSTLVVNGKNLVSSNSADNIFFAVDGCLKSMEKEFV